MGGQCKETGKTFIVCYSRPINHNISWPSGVLNTSIGGTVVDTNSPIKSHIAVFAPPLS